MKSEIQNKTGNIKRRNFFLYLGVSLVGIFSFSKLPFKIIQSKINKEIRKNKKIRIEENPFAVKRSFSGRKNG